MRILITGAIGNVGPAVVERLLDAGHELRAIGRRPGMSVPGARYAACDVTDMDCLGKQMDGIEAVVHLAALGHPTLGTPETVFRINAIGTFNVYEAAARAGIRRVVNASSINALGFGLGVKDYTVHYLPVDEAHPTSSTDAYSFSKNVVEEIADYYWRRDGISGVSLRLPAVLNPPVTDEAAIRRNVAACRREMEELDSLSEAQREARFSRWRASLVDARRKRWNERPPAEWEGMFPDSQLMQWKADFWAAVDARDSALAIEQALVRDYEGSHALFLTDAHNWTGVPSGALARMFYPEVRTWKRPVEGTETLVSIERARSFLGYEPRYSASRFFE